jgi:lysophospholipase L1-like esterase
LTARSARSPDGYTYVALGDSISIGDYAGGPGRGGASLLARNRADHFPHWCGRDLSARHPALRYHLLAVDGGTTQSLLESQLPWLAAAGLAPAVVTLTIGGNDLLGAYGDTARAQAVVHTVLVRVGQALTRLKRLMRAAEDPVVVGTVYDPSDGSGDASRLGLPPWPEAVDVLAELNNGLRAVAVDHRARIAEIHDQFLGHGLAVGNPAQPEARPDNRALWYCDVIEPNAWGTDAVRARFWQALHPSGPPP